MYLHARIHLEDCPFCGGAGFLEEENGWCWYVMCISCGSQTAAVEYKKPEDREDAAERASFLWNSRKVVRSDLSE